MQVHLAGYPSVFLMGIALGAGVSMLVPATGPSSEAVVSPPVVAAKAPVDPDALSPEACKQALAESQQRHQLDRQQLRYAGAVSLGWPEDVDETLRPDAIRDWLDEAMVDFEGGTLESLHCDEYPCIAVVEYDAGQPISTAVAEPLRDDFRKHTHQQAPVYVKGRNQRPAVAVLTLGPSPAPNTVEDRRLKFRTDRISEALDQR